MPYIKGREEHHYGETDFHSLFSLPELPYFTHLFTGLFGGE